MVRVGVEWVNRFHPDEEAPCRSLELHYTDEVAASFLAAMRSFGHADVFDWGNDNAWWSDFDHPDFGGDSLEWSDNVHFTYFAGHGGQFHYEERRAFNIGFSTRHEPVGTALCRSLSPQWRLGVKRLKWLALDSCQIVTDLDPGHIVEVWAGPMQGLHLLFGFIDLNRIGPYTYRRRVDFAFAINAGYPMARAWLDTAYGWESPQDGTTRPIVIAAGATRDEAMNRRDHETLGWVYFDVSATNWLAWKWRG